MKTINVSFSDETKTKITGYATAPQDDATWPNQGTVGTNDPMWAAYYNAQDPVLIQPYLPAPTGS